MIEDDLKDVCQCFLKTLPASPDMRISESIVTEHSVKRFAIPITLTICTTEDYLWDTENVPRAGFIRDRVGYVADRSGYLKSYYARRARNVHQTTFEQLLVMIGRTEQRSRMPILSAHPDLPSQCVVLMMEQNRQYQLTPNNARMAKNLNTNLLNLTNRLKQEYDGYFLVTRKSDRAVFLLQFDKECTSERREADAQRFIDTLIKCIDEKGVLDYTFIGVGSCVETFRSLPMSLQQAEQTVRILMSR